MPTWPFFWGRRQDDPKDIVDESELEMFLGLMMRGRRMTGSRSSTRVPREREWDEDMLKPSPRCIRRVEPFNV